MLDVVNKEGHRSERPVGIGPSIGSNSFSLFFFFRIIPILGWRIRTEDRPVCRAELFVADGKQDGHEGQRQNSFVKSFNNL